MMIADGWLADSDLQELADPHSMGSISGLCTVAEEILRRLKYINLPF